MRKAGQKTGAQNPHTRGGRRAHGPKVEKEWSQKIDSREKRIARDSAIAASCDPDTVSSRGHRFEEGIRFPIIIDDYVESRGKSDEKYDIESIPNQYSTRKFVAMMEGLGLSSDLERSKSGRTIRAGKGTMRARKYRTQRASYWWSHRKEGWTKALETYPASTSSRPRTCAQRISPGRGHWKADSLDKVGSRGTGVIQDGPIRRNYHAMDHREDPGRQENSRSGGGYMENNNRIEFIVRRRRPRRTSRRQSRPSSKSRWPRSTSESTRQGSMQAFAWPKDMMQRRLRSS